jgi:hypothetical protein
MKTEQMTKNGSLAVESILHKVKLMSFFWLIITTDGPPPRPKSWPASSRSPNRHFVPTSKKEICGANEYASCIRSHTTWSLHRAF